MISMISFPPLLCLFSILGALYGLAHAIDLIRAGPPAELPPAQRRAQREDCRAKGL